MKNLKKITITSALAIALLNTRAPAQDIDFNDYANQVQAKTAADYDLLSRACPGYKSAVLPKDAEMAETAMERLYVDQDFTTVYLHTLSPIIDALQMDTTGYCKDAIANLPLKIIERLDRLPLAQRRAAIAGSFRATERMCKGYKMPPDIAEMHQEYFKANDDSLFAYFDAGIRVTRFYIEKKDGYCAAALASLKDN